VGTTVGDGSWRRPRVRALLHRRAGTPRRGALARDALWWGAMRSGRVEL